MQQTIILFISGVALLLSLKISATDDSCTEKLSAHLKGLELGLTFQDSEKARNEVNDIVAKRKYMDDCQIVLETPNFIATERALKAGMDAISKNN